MTQQTAYLSTESGAHPTQPTRKRLKTLSVVFTLVLALLATACGGGSIDIAEQLDQQQDTEPTVAAIEPTVAAVEPTAVPPTPEPVEEGSIEDVAAATVKIIGEGTFVPPYETQTSSGAGIGTGFIISEDGLVVTNNHVVTGAAFLEVYLEGSTEPTNARLLGVSECSDLAVLDLEGDGYEFLDFRTEPVNAGLDVFAAGYPLNLDSDLLAVDYTLTRGIVSTTQADGESNWASVDAVIEHDARIRGGNSGGPLVDEMGRVVGINYAGEDTNDLNFAISAQEALATIEALKTADVESLGINGQAILNEDFSGVWVSAVESGSPADNANIQAGDVILKMEGLDLGRDGTMSDYCDIIRTNGPTDTLSIEVLRISTEELLEGQINGEPLSQTFSFAMELADDVGDGTETGPVGTAGYDSYEFVADDSGSVGVEVPTEWIDRNGVANENFGESIYAAPEIAGFTETWDVPGIIVERSTALSSADIDSVLDEWTYDCAESVGREDFQTSDEVFTGKWDLFTGCGGTETALLTIAVSPPDGNSVVRMLIQIVSDRDLEAADRAIASFDAVS